MCDLGIPSDALIAVPKACLYVIIFNFLLYEFIFCQKLILYPLSFKAYTLTFGTSLF